MCGDNAELDPYIQGDFAEICDATPADNVTVVIQRDRPPRVGDNGKGIHAGGANRYVLRPGRRGVRADGSLDGPTNTGDPQTAIDFLRWGIDQAPAKHVAIVFAGLGISEQYAVENLKVGTETDDEIVRQLFSICHDESSRDALEVRDLRAILSAVVERLGRPVDLVGMDAGATAFVEVAYQMHGLAKVFVASQRMFPDDGWPYRAILEHWHEAEGDPYRLGAAIVDAVARVYPCDDVPMVAVDVTRLEDTARVLDTLSVALMQAVGDDDVLQCVLAALYAVPWITTEQYDVASGPTKSSGKRKLLPAVDLLNMLEELRERLARRAPALDKKPASRRACVEQLTRLTESALAALARGHDNGGGRDRKPLIVHARPDARRGLSIMLPATMPPKGVRVDPDGVPAFSLSGSNYLDLEFSRSVHWSALVGAVQLITERPHALWRLISSMLADSSAPVRDALLQRLISRDSLIEDVSKQFSSLGTSPRLTLSLDPRPPTDAAKKEKRTYRLRLESSVAGATVAQQDSVIYQPTLDATFEHLKTVLRGAAADLATGLTAYGRTLGEDLLRTLEKRLAAECDPTAEYADAEWPHLCFQIPTELMPFPWELIRDRHGLLSERFALGRQVFMDAQSTKQRLPRRNAREIRVLVIGDPKFETDYLGEGDRRWRPQQLAGARTEALAVISKFEDLKKQLDGVPPIHIEHRIHEVLTVDEVRDLLRDEYDIIHFAGHGLFDERDPDGSAWLLSDGMLRADSILNTLAWCDSPPWLIFANACEAAMDKPRAEGAYQSAVYGLASAFISQGVTGYIAPLWPVDDQVAQDLALEFYDGLLIERLSVGQALRRAKVRVRGPGTGGNADDPTAPVHAPSWAGMILYGDPAPRFLDSLWTPAPERNAPTAPAPVRTLAPAARRPVSRTRTVMQAPVADTIALTSGPGMVPIDVGATRGAPVLPADVPVVELVDRNGIRSWQIIDPRTHAARPLPGSTIGDVATQQKVQRAVNGDRSERGLGDYVRVVGRWMVDKVTGGDRTSLVRRLAEQYDRETVPKERLVLVGDARSLEDAPAADGDWSWLETAAAKKQRVVLIIHGTFSKTAAPVDGLGEAFFATIRRSHAAVLGWDHWTLSKSPEENARELLRALPPSLRTGNRLDVITHSRGGLVARAVVELLGRGAFRRVVFVGTPNAGTNLASPANWGRAADLLVNFVHADPLGVYGRLSGMLVNLGIRDLLSEVPGLSAQNPLATGKRDFLGRLQQVATLPKAVTYAAVAANYEPALDELNAKRLLTEADTAIDGFYPGPNDLVVDTAHVWAIDGKPGMTTVSKLVPIERLLLFNPDASVDGPANVHVCARRGVHHTNLFGFKETRDFISEQLTT